MRHPVRWAAALAALSLLAGCAAPQGPKRYEATFLDVFDTVTTVLGYAEDEETFRAAAQEVHDGLLSYHQLFDIYNDYDGINNLKTVNDNAGIAPVEVDGAIVELLTDCKDFYETTAGRVNVAMGSVLSLWHDARETAVNDPESAALPDEAALKEAAKHTDLSLVEIDEEASTVYLPDPDMRLDVGAVAKGWSVERVCEDAPEGLLLSVGGNVRATGDKADGSPWVAGVQNPDGGAYLCTVEVRDVSVVTSGDYQRYFTVDGVRYHHIIDPDTLYPASYWRSVTIL